MEAPNQRESKSNSKQKKSSFDSRLKKMRDEGQKGSNATKIKQKAGAKKKQSHVKKGSLSGLKKLIGSSTQKHLYSRYKLGVTNKELE